MSESPWRVELAPAAQRWSPTRTTASAPGAPYDVRSPSSMACRSPAAADGATDGAIEADGVALGLAVAAGGIEDAVADGRAGGDVTADGVAGGPPLPAHPASTTRPTAIVPSFRVGWFMGSSMAAAAARRPVRNVTGRGPVGRIARPEGPTSAQCRFD